VDGFQFLTRLHENRSLRDIPVVVLTAKTLGEEDRIFLAERTILVLSKSTQPIGSLGHALAVIAARAHGAEHAAQN
jgi:CheY-like chemotaxis protein